MKNLIKHTNHLGACIQAECERGLFNGRVKMWYPNGNLFLDGHYINGHGRGCKNIWYDDGQPRSSHYQEEMVEGEHISFEYNNRIEENNIRLYTYANRLIGCRMLECLNDVKELAKKEYANEI